MDLIWIRYIFSRSDAHALLKAATKICFRGKKSAYLAFSDYFSEEQTEEYD